MNKALSAIIGLAVAAGIGYVIYDMSQPKDMMEQENSINDDTMMENDNRLEGDAMMKKDEDGIIIEGDAMMKSEGMMKSEDTAMMKQEGAAYVVYQDGVIGNGQSSVLFFHAAWCPSCKQADKELQEIYGAGNAKLTTYKVDYDTQVDLKKKYGITYQHTFVVIDGEGNAVKTMTSPTAAQIAVLVK